MFLYWSYLEFFEKNLIKLLKHVIKYQLKLAADSQEKACKNIKYFQIYGMKRQKRHAIRRGELFFVKSKRFS